MAEEVSQCQAMHIFPATSGLGRRLLPTTPFVSSVAFLMGPAAHVKTKQMSPPVGLKHLPLQQLPHPFKLYIRSLCPEWGAKMEGYLTNTRPVSQLDQEGDNGHICTLLISPHIQ